MNVKQIVTERIIKQLEEGAAPWHQPWFAVGKKNISGHVYHGVNRMLLASHPDTLFLTYRQAQELGGNVRKGEKAEIVTFWKINRVMSKDSDTGESKPKDVPLLRYYYVFGLSQIGGIAPEKLDAIKNKSIPSRNNKEDMDAEDFLVATGAKIVHEDKTSAFYSPKLDFINLPDLSQFDNSSRYYATAFHELGHWTGAPDRCNREIKNGFGSLKYGREELVAEITASMLCYEFGKDNIPEAAGYVKSWIEAIKEDNQLIFWASKQADNAIEYLKGKLLEQAA